MALNAEGSLSYRFQGALSYPLFKRCSELRKLFTECSFRDAQTLFPSIVESLFGFGGRQDWGLRHIHRHLQPKEFDVVRHFVSPDGPLLDIAYKLMNDVYLKYEFPVSCLPLPVIRSLEVDVVPPFYVGKLPGNSPGRLASVLSLNPFEFFLFHLSYFLVRSQNHRSMLDWNDDGDPVYAFIMEDYLHHFLPLNGAYPQPPAQCVLTPSRFPSTADDGSIRRSSGDGSTVLSILRDRDSRSLRKSLFKQPNAAINRQNSTGSLHPGDSPPVDWRPEVFAQVVIEFWLNHYSFESQRSFTAADKSRSAVSSRSFNLDRSWTPNDGSFVQNSSLSFSDSFFPSAYHVRLARLFVKHSHYFANSARLAAGDKFDVFKRALVPQFLRKKLYAFVRHLFDHWPLDASFRFVLELWLSYIQPWRYVDSWSHVRRFEETDNPDEGNRILSLSRWRPFVEENLPFYSVLFRRMLQRVSRVDLGSIKNANMLHRLTKVFSQADLVNLIREAEALLREQAAVGTRLATTNASNCTGLLSPRSATDVGRAGLVRQHVADLEGPGRAYVPMFGEEVAVQARQVASLVRQSKVVLEDRRASSEASGKPGFLRRLWSHVRTDHADSEFEDGGGGNRPRAEHHLEAAFRQLSSVYDILPVHHDGHPGSFESSTSRSVGSSTMESIVNDEGSLTPLGRHKVLNRMCRPNLSYETDPDLQPIRSDEFGFLVRALFRLATSANEKFGADISDLYNRPDFLGRFARQLISEPIVCRTFRRHGTPSPCEVKVLPPRLSFRRFASKQNLGYMMTVFFVAYCNNLGLFAPLSVIVIAITLYALWGALSEPHRKVSTLAAMK